MQDDRSPLPELDTSVAHPARVYNYWLGGKDNFAADRQAGDAVAAQLPSIVASARANRDFHGRVVSYLAGEAGIDQFLDLGTGLPVDGANTHDIAQDLNPWSRVVYVDNDQTVMAHARALLTSNPRGACDYIAADVRDVAYIRREAGRNLDFGKPVAVLLLAILHLIPNDEHPAGIVASLAGLLAPGSYIAISHTTADFAPEPVAAAVEAYNAAVSEPVTARTLEQVTELFCGNELVPPGIRSVSAWRPPIEGNARKAGDLYGGVAQTGFRPAM